MGHCIYYNRVIVIAICFLTFSNLYSQSVPTSGLVAWYPFNGNAIDGSTNGNNGTVNGAALTTDRKGNANSAYYVSGIGCQPHILATVNTTSVNTSGKVTFAFWIYREGDGCSAPRVFQFGDGSKENDISGGHFVLGWANGEKRIFIEHASAGIKHRDYNWGSDLNDRTWYHIAYTFNGSIAKLYINGQLINTRSTTGSAKLEQQFSMGRFNKPAYDAFNGKLDDIGVWNRALSDAEILGLFKPGQQIDNIEPGNKKNTLLWTSTSDTAVKKYKIYRSTSAIPDNSLIAELATISDVNVNSFIDSSALTNGVNYFYRMKWVFAGSTGDSVGSFGNELTGTPNLVAIPINFSINKEGSAVRLNWDLVAESGVQYQVYRGTAPTSKTFLDTLRVNTYLDNSISSSNVYYYWVRTLSSNGAFSDFSEALTMSAVPFINQDSSRNGIVLLKLNQISNTAVNRLNIYKGTSVSPSIKYDSTILSRSYSDSANNIFNTILYYRITSIGSGLNESSYSNEIRTISFKPSTLLSPINLAVKSDTTCKFVWSKIPNALSYKLQYSVDSLFTTNVIEQVVTDTSYTKAGLEENKNYYWRVQTQDTVHYSNWSNFNRFQTFLIPPIISAVKAGNRVDTIIWSIKNTTNVKYFKIYRDTVTNPIKLLDSISGSLSTYIDKISLQLNIKYYYRIIAGNQQNIESDYSNILAATPTNTLPKAIKLVNKTVQNSGEYNFVKLSYSGSGSYDFDGSIASYNWYVNDSLVNSKDSILSYFFKLGTNTVKLVVIDNDGGKDTSSSILNLTTLQKQFQSGILGGISAINQNYILTADTSFNSITGSSVSLLNRLGNTIIAIVVQSKIFTTPSVSSDSSIFITNGSSLNGYSKVGVSLWPTIPLGGISYVTPTIDSNLNRIYVGVSNKNFFAYDYKTGKNVWSIICDAPINTSAVISGDRKLIFASQSGTLYGFDISKSDVQTTPKWKMSFGDIVTKSPAVDASSNIYVGTDAGRLIKFMLNTDGTVSVKWNVTLSSSIQTSPVIDADSNIYVGTEKGDFYKIDRSNGTTIWSYNVGAAIHSTPNISEYGTIYVPNMNGLVTAITTDKRVLWKYQDNAAISANSLYINNMLYIASEKGTFTGIYDNPNSVNVNTSFASSDKSSITSFGSASSSNSMSFPSMLDNSNSNPKSIFTSDALPTVLARTPVWGTFQGDYRRTGTLSIVCPSNLTISKDSTGSLISNTSNYIQWYKDGTAITNASSPTYKPSNAGSYSVKNNQVGCNSISSNSYYYIVTDVINLSAGEFIKISPNPFINQLNFDFVVKGYQKLNIEAFDMATGSKKASIQNLIPGMQINLSQLSAGTYVIKVSSNDGKINYQFKMIKL